MKIDLPKCQLKTKFQFEKVIKAIRVVIESFSFSFTTDSIFLLQYEFCPSETLPSDDIPMTIFRQVQRDIR